MSHPMSAERGAACVRQSGASSMASDAPAGQVNRAWAMLTASRVHFPWEGGFADQRAGTEVAARLLGARITNGPGLLLPHSVGVESLVMTNRRHSR